MRPLVEKPTAHGVYEILAQGDKQAGVWVAESEDVPGLVAEPIHPMFLLRSCEPLSPSCSSSTASRVIGRRDFAHGTTTKIVMSWPFDGQLHAKAEGDSARTGVLL